MKGQPLIAQSLCSDIWNKNSEAINRQGKKPVIEKENVETSFSYEEYGHIIEHSWSILSPEEQAIICKIASNPEGSYERTYLGLSKRWIYLNSIVNQIWLLH